MESLVVCKRLTEIMLKTVLVLAVISATSLGDPVLKPQIIGGTDANRGDNPHMCSLRSYSHGCGASIISAKWAITAAHCVAGYVIINYTVM